MYKTSYVRTKNDLAPNEEKLNLVKPCNFIFETSFLTADGGTVLLIGSLGFDSSLQLIIATF